MMNERIRELYEQAHDVEKQTLYLIVPTMLPEIPPQVSREDEGRTFNPEKFAELIIEEAAKAHLCDSDGVVGKYSDSDRYYFETLMKKQLGLK